MNSKVRHALQRLEIAASELRRLEENGMRDVKRVISECEDDVSVALVELYEELGDE